MTRTIGNAVRRMAVQCDACGKSDSMYVAASETEDIPLSGYVLLRNAGFTHDICTKCLYAAFPTLLKKGDDNAA